MEQKAAGRLCSSNPDQLAWAEAELRFEIK